MKIIENSNNNIPLEHLCFKGDIYFKDRKYRLAMLCYRWAIVTDKKKYCQFEDIWSAINAGNTQKAKEYANKGMILALDSKWEESLISFLMAIDTELFLVKIFRDFKPELYYQFFSEIKTVLRADIEITSKLKSNYSVSYRAIKYLNDPGKIFYKKLLNFTEIHGKKVLENKYFYGFFSDYLIGEHKHELNYLKKIIEIKPFKFSELINQDSIVSRRYMIEIFFYLLKIRVGKY